MDYEKKYKEAMKACKELSDSFDNETLTEELEKIFPELKESDDEKIIKEMKAFFSRIMLGQENFLREDYDWNAWLAWLEKQCEQKAKYHDVCDKCIIQPTCQSDCFLQQGEQNPTDKVEPKFHVGDKVKRKDNPHLTYILKRLTDDGDYEFHAIGKDGHEGCTCFAGVKYQDDWELVEQKPAWSVEDNRIVAEIYHALESCEYEWDSDMSKEKDWLESLGNRVQPQQEWSEEDEYHKRQILRILKDNGCSQTLQEKTEKWIEERLKSFRPQNTWKPSEEQMKALWDSIPEDVKEISEREMLLNELYKDLKKL